MQKLAKTFHKIFSPSEKGLGEGGFTLIELLVVVAILGVLAAVVTLNVGSFIGKGTVEAANAEAHNVQTAILAYMAATGTTPGATVGPGATYGSADGYLNGFLEATYTIGGDGNISAATATAGGKWAGLTYANGRWS